MTHFYVRWATCIPHLLIQAYGFELFSDTTTVLTLRSLSIVIWPPVRRHQSRNLQKMGFICAFLQKDIDFMTRLQLEERTFFLSNEMCALNLPGLVYYCEAD